MPEEQQAAEHLEHPVQALEDDADLEGLIEKVSGLNQGMLCLEHPSRAIAQADRRRRTRGSQEGVGLAPLVEGAAEFVDALAEAAVQLG